MGSSWQKRVIYGDLGFLSYWIDPSILRVVIDWLPIIVETWVEFLLIVFHNFLHHQIFNIVSLIIIDEWLQYYDISWFEHRINSGDMAIWLIVWNILKISKFIWHECIVEIQQFGKTNWVSKAKGIADSLLLIFTPRKIKICFWNATLDIDDIVIYNLCSLLAIEIFKECLSVRDAICLRNIVFKLDIGQNLHPLIYTLECVIQLVLLSQRILAQEVELCKITVFEGTDWDDGD